MRYMKHFVLLAVLMVPFAYSQAQVRVGIGVGVGPAYVGGPPVCTYGYYNYYPYACAPYGYYAPQYFVDGVFVGVGPWYHWGHPAAFWNRGWYRGGDWGHDRWYGHRDWDHRGYAYGHERFERGEGRGYVHGDAHADSGFRGGHAFRGGEGHGSGFHGGGGFHGGRR